jgi:hypothetical protein
VYPFLTQRFVFLLLLAVVGAVVSGTTGISNMAAMEKVLVLRGGVQLMLEGEVVVEAQDGGIMLRATDGRIWMIQPDEIKSRKSDSVPFKSMDVNTLGKRVIQSMPGSAGNFRVLKSNGYLVVYNTSPAYAGWVKGVYMRLTVAFKNFWKNKGVELQKPDVPLCIVIFKNKQEFDAYSRATLGSVQGNALAYYNMQSNQVVMYDLTGIAQLGGKRISSTVQLGKILRQPAAGPMVATIVHEAVHQISYNSGLQKRFGPYPFWLNEGLAMFFEVPDLKSKRGWHGIGKINHVRLDQVKQMIRGDATEFFNAILKRDDRFREADQLLNSYAESWALSFYLIHRKPKEYVGYLQEINSMPPLSELDENERMKLFAKHFGDLEVIKKECFELILR